MDRWFQRQGEAPSPAAKRARGKGKLDDTKMQQMMLLCCKLGLANAQSLRNVMATVFLTFLFQGDSPIITAGMTAGKDYADQAKGNKGHKLGAPQFFVWAAISQALVQCEKGAAEHKSILDRHRQSVPEMSMLKGIVLHCRISRCYDRAMKRLTLAFGPEHAELKNAVVQLLRDAGGDEKVGQAPPGNLERQVQDLLDELAD